MPDSQLQVRAVPMEVKRKLASLAKLEGVTQAQMLGKLIQAWEAAK